MSWQAFNQRVVESADLQQAIAALTTPVQLFELARQCGIELTGEDMQAIAQNAYHQWINTLDGNNRLFFEQAHTDPALNERLKQCSSPTEAIALAQECNIQLTEADLQQAATSAASISGFSFEKLWFRKLGLRSQ